MVDKHVKSQTWALWISVCISLSALFVSFLAYRQSSKPDPMIVRFRYINVSISGNDDDPFVWLNGFAKDKISIVENDLFSAMKKILTSLDESEEIDPSAFVFRFLVVENVSEIYFKRIDLHVTRIESSEAQTSTSLTDTVELAGLKPEEFVAIPLSFKSRSREYPVRIVVKSVVTKSAGGRTATFSVRKEHEIQVEIRGAKAFFV